MPGAGMKKTVDLLGDRPNAGESGAKNRAPLREVNFICMMRDDSAWSGDGSWCWNCMLGSLIVGRWGATE